jgi:hypothetical protein
VTEWWLQKVGVFGIGPDLLFYIHQSCLELQHKHDLDSLDRLSLAFSCYLFSRLD